jgi:hypothetical protein
LELESEHLSEHLFGRTIREDLLLPRIFWAILLRSILPPLLTSASSPPETILKRKKRRVCILGNALLLAAAAITDPTAAAAAAATVAATFKRCQYKQPLTGLEPALDACNRLLQRRS